MAIAAATESISVKFRKDDSQGREGPLLQDLR